jgi:hypothetical protein
MHLPPAWGETPRWTPGLEGSPPDAAICSFVIMTGTHRKHLSTGSAVVGGECQRTRAGGLITAVTVMVAGVIVAGVMVNGPCAVKPMPVAPAA